ncbi:MAG: ArsR/SmtB family transcription factor [Anaerotardibacter sp.]
MNTPTKHIPSVKELKDKNVSAQELSESTLRDEGCSHTDSSIQELPDDELLYDLADLFKVFSDTTRIKILYALMDADLCVAHIAEVVSCSQSAVSHQLRILKQARLVKFQREGKNIIYSLADDHVFTILAQGMTHICE